MIQVWSLLWIFFKIGACTFGGGYAMVELVAEQVTSHGWMEMQEIIDFIAISESTPGPIAVNTAVFCARRKATEQKQRRACLALLILSPIVVTIVWMAFGVLFVEITGGV